VEIYLKEFPAWNDQWMETTHQSQPAPSTLGAAYIAEAPMVEESNFGFLEEYNPEAMLTDEASSFDIDPAQYSDLQQICADTFPQGVPEETDVWATLLELTEIASPDSTSAVFLDDLESFFKPFPNMDDFTQQFDMTSIALPIQA
jgi:hypothetical protein